MNEKREHAQPLLQLNLSCTRGREGDFTIEKANSFWQSSMVTILYFSNHSHRAKGGDVYEAYGNLKIRLSKMHSPCAKRRGLLSD